MEAQIRQHLQHPVELERLYRQDQRAFSTAFEQLYPSIAELAVAQTWHARLNYSTHKSLSVAQPWSWLLLLIALAGAVAKLPDWLGLEPDRFFQRNIGFVVIPFLMAYFFRANQLSWRQMLWPSLLLLAAACYINLLPQHPQSDTLNLVQMHLPLFLGSLLGLSFLGTDLRSAAPRVAFLRFLGDLVVMSTLLLIAAGLLTGLTFGLFTLININIEQLFSHWLVIWGGPAIPLLATHLVHTQPQLVQRISPIIAQIFTPLVVLTLLSFLVAMAWSGQDPYNDRDFLITFNALLIGVMALIFFSVVEQGPNSSRWSGRILLLLALLTAIINGIALSAILFRISSWGFTPNRLAVLGSNVLLLVHLLWVGRALWRNAFHGRIAGEVEGNLARLLPLYPLWTLLVILLFPLIFGW